MRELPCRSAFAIVAALATVIGCAHRTELRERERERVVGERDDEPPMPLAAPSAPYAPVRVAVPPPKLVGGKRSPSTNSLDRPVEIAGRMVRFQDKTLGMIEPHWTDGGGLEWITSWRSDFPVSALALYGQGRGVCLATEDGRVGCLQSTNHHGMQVEWLLREHVRSLAVFRSGVGWHLCFVRSEGSPHCETLRSSWAVEDGATVRFQSSEPSEPQILQTQRLNDAFGKLGRLKKIFAEPTCAIDAADRLQCLEDKGMRQVLEGVTDATPECALMLDGTVRCWGANQFGQVGIGRRSGREATPMTVVGLTDVEKISSSGVNACAVRRDGALFCWGAQFGPDFALAAAKIPLCRLQDRPPPPPETPCPSAPRGGDDLCGRTRYNAQRYGRQEGPIVLRDAAEQCAAPGEDYAPTPTKITVIDEAVYVEPNHDGLRIVRRDGIIVEANTTFLREIAVRSPSAVK
jgi:hypothetical protein